MSRRTPSTVKVGLTPQRTAIPADATVLVIDVLRATTTLIQALANGASGVIPVASLEEARSLKTAEPEALLCGERNGVRVSGFDLGNSPSEYTPSVVHGRRLIFASTNGSIAMIKARGARRRWLTGFVNAKAVVESVHSDRSILILCAGELGRFGLEDAACAGWLCTGLAARGAHIEGEAAHLALSLAPRNQSEIRALVMGSHHGREMRRMGSQFARDVEECARLDSCDRACEF